MLELYNCSYSALLSHTRLLPSTSGRKAHAWPARTMYDRVGGCTSGVKHEIQPRIQSFGGLAKH